MTREEFEKTRLALMRSGICPACGSPIDLESIQRLSLTCANPTCTFTYQASLDECFEIPGSDDTRPGPARLPPGEA